jgi:hypothetical protein
MIFNYKAKVKRAGKVRFLYILQKIDILFI